MTTDADGNFYLSFGTWVYHVDNYYVPTHIRIPERAPALRFFVRVPRISSEYYAIHAREESYKVYSDEGLAIPEGAAPIASLAVREELEGEPRVTRITAIVELTYEAMETRS